MEISFTFDVDKEIIGKCEEIVGQEISISRNANSEIHIVGFETVAGPRTRMIQSTSAGVDYLDFSRIPENVMVCTNAGAYNEVVAEHAFALILSHFRKISYYNELAHKGIFQREEVESVFGRTMGIIGYGSIGQTIGRIARDFGMKVMAYNRSEKQDGIVTEYYKSMKELSAKSDILVIGLPLTNRTSGIIRKDVLENLKGNVIVNIARGKVVYRNDMLDFLEKNPEKYYLTDVWWDEPHLHDHKFTDKLPENVILTPHVAGGIPMKSEHVILSACRNVRNYLDGNPKNVVDTSEFR